MPPKAPSRDMLLELCTRFVLNCPTEELESEERIMFLVEEAHWFYEDFCRASPEGQQLKSYALREFAVLLFAQHPSLDRHKSRMDDIYKKFLAYKHNVDVFGVILLNPTLEKCLMVKGWKSGASWGFPKGKVNKGEHDAHCAAREVYEEIGFDVSPLIVEADYVETIQQQQQQRTKLFIIPGVSEETGFAPQTRKEISSIAWHWLSDLPASGGAHCGKGQLKYYMVHPFVGPLRKWISNRNKVGKSVARQAAAAPSRAVSTPLPQQVLAPHQVLAPLPPSSALPVQAHTVPAASPMTGQQHAPSNPLLDFHFDVRRVMQAMRAGG